MSTLQTWITSTTERQRTYAQEVLLASVSGRIREVMAAKRVRSTVLARRLGCGKAAALDRQSFDA